MANHIGKPITSPFGHQELRDRRLALGLTQDLVAAAAGLSVSLIRGIELGLKKKAPTDREPYPRRGPHPWPEAIVDRVRVVLAEAERTGALPTLPPLTRAPRTPRPRRPKPDPL